MVKFHYTIEKLEKTLSGDFVEKCSKAGVEDVIATVLFGDYLDRNENSDYNKILKLKEKLGQAGITMSVRPCYGFQSKDAQERYLSQRGFRRRIDSGGGQSIEVCPLDPDWKKTYLDFIIDLCRDLQPLTVWLDSRYAQFDCFCQKHMSVFCSELNRDIDRQSFAKAVESGEGEEYAVYASANRFIQSQYLIDLAESLHEAGIAYGLMTDDISKLAADTQRFCNMFFNGVEQAVIIGEGVNDSLLYCSHLAFSDLKFFEAEHQSFVKNLRGLGLNEQSRMGINVGVLSGENSLTEKVLAQMGYPYKRIIKPSQGQVVLAETEWLAALTPYETVHLFKKNYVICEDTALAYLKTKGLEYLIKSPEVFVKKFDSDEITHVIENLFLGGQILIKLKNARAKQYYKNGDNFIFLTQTEGQKLCAILASRPFKEASVMSCGQKDFQILPTRLDGGMTEIMLNKDTALPALIKLTSEVA